MVILAFAGLLYLSEAVDSLLSYSLDQHGIVPRSVDGLQGVAFAPFLHGDWQHLLANTLPVLILGFLAMSAGIGQFVAVTLTIWLVSGFGTWLIGSGGVHIGASGLIFGWLTFLLVRGLFTRSVWQIVVAAVLLFFYGGMLFGVLPTAPDGISWEGHLFGALGGLLAARLVTLADRPDRTVPAAT